MINANDNQRLKYQWADWYLNIGWSLIPILPFEKRPPHGFGWKCYQSFLPTKTEVHQWINFGWRLAVVTGSISNLVIIDDDRVKNGLPEWGFTSSIISTSEHFGKHFYYTYDRELHQASNKILHIDIKALHNYCLVPPFGNRYWISNPSRENLKKLEPVPEEIVKLINPNPKYPIAHPPKPFIQKAKPNRINGETWIQRVERASNASLEVFVYPYLLRQINIYGGIRSLCPFHIENSPSFELKYPIGNQTDFHGHCYGCNTHVIGIIAFHKERTGLNFKSAVRDLAP